MWWIVPLIKVWAKMAAMSPAFRLLNAKKKGEKKDFCTRSAIFISGGFWHVVVSGGPLGEGHGAGAADGQIRGCTLRRTRRDLGREGWHVDRGMRGSCGPYASQKRGSAAREVGGVTAVASPCLWGMLRSSRKVFEGPPANPGPYFKVRSA